LINQLDAALTAGRSNQIFLDGRIPIIEATTAKELGLRDGQVIQALVQTRGESLGLLLQGRLIEAPDNQQWTSGQTMSFRVQVNANGVWTLRPLAQPSAGMPTETVSAPVVAQPVISRAGNLLFRPHDMQDMTQLFRPGVLDGALRNMQRPDLQQLWHSLQLSMANLTPQAISQALAGAIGSEVWLARGRLPAQSVGDPKQLLKQLLNTLSDLPDQEEPLQALTRQVEGAIDTLEANQVQAVQAQSQQEILFSLVLPFRDAEPVTLEFTRSANPDAKSPTLTVNIHSRTELFGDVWLKTDLLEKAQVELTMWTANELLVNMARARAPELNEQLQQTGLQMRAFQVIHGQRHAPAHPVASTASGLVVDVRA